MKYGICSVSVAPIRSEAADSSEIITQLLFGEFVEIIEEKEKWWQVKLLYDGYIGWVDPKQLELLTEEEYRELSRSSPSFVTDQVGLMTDENNNPMMLSYATALPGLKEKSLQFAGKTFGYEGSQEIIQEKKSSELIEIAKNFINTPYLWGGRSVFGIDCSGFTQQVYKMCGYKLPRDAHEQAGLGIAMGFVAESKPGDLAFFDNEKGKIIHVGIVLEGQKIIHAHGKVRVDLLDDNGIFNIDQQKYSHKLRFVKSLID